ncbi:MAG: phosphate ABC transporter permease PstA [Alkalibacterium sp.]|uniref:Phosphate transport system permease protein PstA n=2 Tax=Alkalibacterium gilvum TaxID=1130080 RepID=A0A1H6TUP3_9LACT|nr:MULTISPECIES: phosphate ABC transporter permease PstA [Alkalibacterium]MDN6194073.1 phosphate ABC transporter permease PstA [Alkalibacterium sp.]MDN6294240.1 phosphate ABC transporter permease PstA [Alkalibacterium sp.]MDN6295207.1 phosphate ABC transporter permease PstA [Alkalibacterium sp.]MDN6327214.1 phosphate ABC transporter permease PstA [Alkalibacterium sp.]MDN6398355.1 phosphate ABC transporter permease PstA [Alkalibacterium sp.]
MKNNSVTPDEKQIDRRIIKNKLAKGVFFLGTLFGIIVLAALLIRIFTQGIAYLDFGFLSNFASRRPEDAGIRAAILGTIWIMSITIPVSLILGVSTSIYLEEYAPRNKFTRFIELNLANLAGVPSVVFGLLGLTVFVRLLEMGRSILAGGFTMSLLILPVIVVASKEAIRAIPQEQYDAAYAMGATKWQIIRTVVLPAATPGILTGAILSLSRGVGETASLLMIGAMTFIAYTPASVLDGFTVLPIQIFSWASRPQAEFQAVAAAGSIVLLVILIVMNTLAIIIRNNYSKRY